MTEENRVLDSVKSGCEIIKAGINGVPIVNELRDGLLAGESSISTGNTALVGSLIHMGCTVITQNGEHTVEKKMFESFSNDR